MSPIVVFLCIVRGLKEGWGGHFFCLQECWCTGQRRRGAWRLESQCGKLQLTKERITKLQLSKERISKLQLSLGSPH